MRSMIMAVVLGALSLTSCKDKPKPSPAPIDSGAQTESSAPAKPAKPVDADIGRAKAMLSRFTLPNADTAKLAAELIPKEADYAAVFTDDAIEEAKTAYGPRFERGQLSIVVEKGARDVSVVKATTEELRKREGNALRFPGGYLRIAHRLKPGVAWYMFSFASQGAKPKLTYDGLVFVNGHWAMFPSPGRVLSATAQDESGSAADVAGDDGARSAP